MKEINNNIEEPVCSPKVSQLLKEKGFDVSTSQFYKNDGLVDPKRFIGLFYKNSDFAENTFIAAPTQAIALEWIRVNFGVHIADHFNEYDEKYQYLIWVFELNRTHSSKDIIDNGKQFDTSQKAIEAGLLYALTNLIL